MLVLLFVALSGLASFDMALLAALFPLARLAVLAAFQLSPLRRGRAAPERSFTQGWRLAVLAARAALADLAVLAALACSCSSCRSSCYRCFLLCLAVLAALPALAPLAVLDALELNSLPVP